VKVQGAHWKKRAGRSLHGDILSLQMTWSIVDIPANISSRDDEAKEEYTIRRKTLGSLRLRTHTHQLRRGEPERDLLAHREEFARKKETVEEHRERK
jgi:hypothetical protein